MKICASTYSFLRMYNKNGFNQLKAIKLSKELGFDGIEISGLYPIDGLSKKEFAKKLREESEAVGIEIANFVFGCDLINGTESRTAQEEIVYAKEMIDIAEILGVKTVRHDVLYSLGKFKSFEFALPHIVSEIREIADYAMEKGIKTMVENHGTICQDSLRMERLFNEVNHENFGLLCDMGNFLCVDENPITASALLMPYVLFVHAKDFYKKTSMEPNPGEGFFMTRGANYLKGAIVGHGIVPVKQCIEVFKRAKYDGYIAIEFEGMEDPIEGMRIGLQNLRKYII